MAGRCDNDPSLNALQTRQRATLNKVLAINAVMFVVIAAAAPVCFLMRSGFWVMASARRELRATV